jgi:hypothetical protein
MAENNKIICPFLKHPKFCVHIDMNPYTSHCARCVYRKNPNKCALYRDWAIKLVKSPSNSFKTIIRGIVGFK